MSLEKALEANTAAINRLTEMLAKEVWHAPAPETTTVPPTEPKAEAKKPASSKAAPAPAAETPASTAAEPDAATSTSLSYDDIKTPFLDLAKRDLAAAQALIAEFGFKTLKDAKPEQYAEILAKLDAIAASEEGMA